MYECIDGITSPWCRILAYKPGDESQFWRAAWKEIDVINGEETSAGNGDEVINGVDTSADNNQSSGSEAINGMQS